MKFPSISLIAAISLLLSVFSISAAASEVGAADTLSSHSAVDIADVYMFRDPPNATPGPGANLIVAMTTQPLASSSFGPTYHFQENALYRLNFTTNPDATSTAHIDIVFGTFGNSALCPSPEPRCQGFTATFPDGAVLQGLATQGAYTHTPLPPVITNSGGIKVFAGPRQDPYFFDHVGFNRVVASGDPSRFTGVDAFRDTNVLAIVVEFPIATVFPDGSCLLTPPFSTPCGVWAETYLPDPPKNSNPKKASSHQVDRVGNPLVNTVLIPADQQAAYDAAQPSGDVSTYQPMMLDTILTLDKRFGTCPADATSASSCNPNVPLLTAVLSPNILRFAQNANDGYPNGRRPQDRVSDLLITLLLQLQINDGTTTKTPDPGFPFLKPPLQP